MKKTMYPVLALVFGVVGFGFRRWQLMTCFDENGLVVYGTPTLALMGFTAAAVAVLATLCLVRKWPEKELGVLLLEHQGKIKSALQGTALFYLMALLGLGRNMIGQDFGLFLAGMGADELLKLLLAVCNVLAVVSAVLLPVSDGKKGFGGAVAPGLLCLNGCIWLIQSYHPHANDPVTMGYIWLVLAGAAAMLGWRYVCSMAYSKPKNKWAMLWSVVTMMLSVIALADGGELYQQSLLLGQVWWFGWYAVLLSE